MQYNYIYVIFFIIFNVQLAAGISNPEAVEPVRYHQFVITGVSPIEFYPSDTRTINITIQNIFNYSGFGVSTVIDPNKAEPIKFTQQLQKYAGNEIGPKRNFTIQYDIYIKDSVTKGTYYVPLTVLWSTVADGTVKQQEDLLFGIRVAENPDVVKIETVNVTTIPEHVNPGDTFKMKVTLKNIGNTKLNQIRAALDVKIPFSSMGSSTEQFIPVLEAFQSSDVIFNLKVDKSAVSRQYNFNFTLGYKDYANRIQSQQNNFGINVEELSEVYIQDITLDPTTLNPGSEGLLMIQLANAGTNEIKNVRITIFGGDKILTLPQNFIGVIRPGTSGSETTTFGISIDPELDAGNYGLNIQVNYDDVNGKHYSRSNLYIIKIDEKRSILPVSGMIYAFMFAALSYVIFLAVGFQIEKRSEKNA